MLTYFSEILHTSNSIRDQDWVHCRTNTNNQQWMGEQREHILFDPFFQKASNIPQHNTHTQIFVASFDYTHFIKNHLQQQRLQWVGIIWPTIPHKHKMLTDENVCVHVLKVFLHLCIVQLSMCTSLPCPWFKKHTTWLDDSFECRRYWTAKTNLLVVRIAFLVLFCFIFI